jgi:hypothetical protein
MTTITATKGELVNLINGLFQVSKNLKILKDELQDLEDMGKPSEEFMALAAQVNEIANGGAEDSKEVIDNLEKENEVLVTARREQMDKITVLMEEEVSVSLNTLTESTLPEDISAAQINNIIKIIE